MRKSGQRAGIRGPDDGLFCAGSSPAGLNFRPNRMSHSGPDRYVIVAISEVGGSVSELDSVRLDRNIRRASFIPV